MGIKKLGVMFLDGKIALPSMLEPMKFTMNESLLGGQMAVYYVSRYGIAAIGGRVRGYTDFELVLERDDLDYDESIYAEIASIDGRIAYVDRACVDSVQLEPEVPAT